MAEQPGLRAAGRRRWLLRVVALLAGAALPLAFAPYDLWWLALLCPALLIGLWSRATSSKEGAWLGFAFGLGLHAAGTWWLFISIHDFGNQPAWLALLIMTPLVVIMAAWHALLGYGVLRWLAPRSTLGCLLLVPSAWVIVEWWRGWFLSGFPWLSLGFSQTDTWLAGLAPVGGVYLVSLALLMGAGGLIQLWQARGVSRWLAPVVLILPWTVGGSLREVAWTHVAGPARSIAILQGNVRQDTKWLESNLQNQLDTYERLHRQALGAELILWPEAAVPELINDHADYLRSVWLAARLSNSAVLMGVIRCLPPPGQEGACPTPLGEDGVDVDLYFNSLLGLGLGAAKPQFYDKRHLVPFSEYFPVPQWLRDQIQRMNLPYSDFTPGDKRQALFNLAGMRLATSICYEAAFAAMLNPETRQADVLVTVTNDGWFGHSSARYQHLQIARMLALESRRYLMRAANDGVSGVIDPWGRIVSQAPEFAEAVVRGSVTPRQGVTPYLLVGNWLAIGLAGFILAAAALAGLRKTRTDTI